MSAGREDAPPALHGREFTIKTEDGQLVVVGVSGPIRFEDEEGNEMGISTPNVPYSEHNHTESGMASANAAVGDSSVGTGNLSNLAVTTEKIADSAVDSAKMAPSAVGTGRLAHSAVDSQVLAPSSVGTGGLVDSAVTARKITDSAVGSRELNQSEAYDFTGGVSISGADIEERFFPAPTLQGNILSGNASIIYQTHISANETMTITQAGLTDDGGSPADSGLAVGIARLDGAGGGVWKATALSADGATVLDSRQGDPLASYTSPSAGQAAVMLDNGNFAGAPGGSSAISAAVWAAANGRVS